MTQNIIIINGPNLNLLGKREESQYGSDTYSDLEKKCNEYANYAKYAICYRFRIRTATKTKPANGWKS